MSSLDGQDQLLDEQIACRARADEYFDGVIAELGAERELDAPVEQCRPVGDVLELACGPGTWTPQLLDHAATVTAVDASREMIAIGSASARTLASVSSKPVSVGAGPARLQQRLTDLGWRITVPTDVGAVLLGFRHPCLTALELLEDRDLKVCRRGQPRVE